MISLPPGHTAKETGKGLVELWIDDQLDDTLPRDKIEEAAWVDYLLALDCMPGQVRPAAMRYLCAMYADALAGEDAGPSAGDLGQSAAARFLHVTQRTMARWCSGASRPPWSAAELLRREITALWPI